MASLRYDYASLLTGMRATRTEIDDATRLHDFGGLVAVDPDTGRPIPGVVALDRNGVPVIPGQPQEIKTGALGSLTTLVILGAAVWLMFKEAEKNERIAIKRGYNPDDL